MTGTVVLKSRTWLVSTHQTGIDAVAPEWTIVSGTWPSRYALVAMAVGSRQLRSIVSRGEWKMLLNNSGTSLSMELAWCRGLEGSGTVLLCGCEVPGSTFISL